MRKIVLATLFGLAVSLSLVAVAFAKEYVINVIVDGKTVTLSVVVDGDSLKVNPQSTGVEIASIAEMQTVATKPATTTATANRNANLRGGPGTNYPVAGGVRTGQALTITGRNQAGDWLQLADGKWIATFLVKGAPAGLPVVGMTENAPTTTQPTPVPTLPPPPTATPVPPAAVGRSGCDESYPDVCIPPYPPDLDCGEIGYRRFKVVGSDPHGFDRDNDGIGCES